MPFLRPSEPWPATLAVFLLFLTSLLEAEVGQSAIPEPSAVIYGSVIADGFPLGAGGTVEARVGTNLIATYSIGSNIDAGLLYVISLPLESLSDLSLPTPGKLRVGDSIALFVNGVVSTTAFSITERGSVTRVDPANVITANSDVDGDGVANWVDNCGGNSNASQADSNGNGIGDACESLQNPGASYTTIGDVGNPADPSTGRGSVDYEYMIGSTEVTNVQYRDFLMAVATQSDPNGLFNANMATDPRGGIIRAGSAAPFTYRVRPNMGDKPVNFVSWLDSARYSNWLQNGKPVGLQGPSTTEQGAFDLLVASPEINAVMTASAGTRLLTLDEWYKAAYFDPFEGVYDDYPTRTSDPNLPDLALATSTGLVDNPALGGDVINYGNGARWASQIGNVTSVGSTMSPSAYQTFDQGGNVSEWLATDAQSQKRTVRGGSFLDSEALLRSDAPATNPTGVLVDPLYEGSNIGLRVVVPEPNFGFQLFCGALLLGIGRKRHSPSF